MMDLSPARLFLTALVAPAVGAIVVWPVVGSEAAVYAGITAYAVNTVVGLPLAVHLIERDARWWRFVAWGAAIGAAPFVVIDVYELVHDTLVQPDPVITAVRLVGTALIPEALRMLRTLAAGTLCGGVTAFSLRLLLPAPLTLTPSRR